MNIQLTDEQRHQMVDNFWKSYVALFNKNPASSVVEPSLAEVYIMLSLQFDVLLQAIMKLGSAQTEQAYRDGMMAAINRAGLLRGGNGK